MPVSVPGNSCRPCSNVATNVPGCPVRVPWECVYYTGSKITTNFSLNTGDTLNTFVTNLLTQGLYQDSGTINFTSSPLSASIKVSASPGNALSSLPDGLFAEGLSLTAANNGVSMSAGNIVQLGNDTGVGSAVLLSNREIPLDTFSLSFLANSGQVSTKIDGTGITLNQTGSASTMRIYCTSSGNLLINNGTKDVAQILNNGNIRVTGNQMIFNSDNSITPSRLDMYLRNTTLLGADRFMSLYPAQASLFIGFGAGKNTSSVPPQSSLAVGDNAMQNVTAFNNTCFGSNGFLALTSGTANIGIGQGVGLGLTTGSNNTFIGTQANRVTTQSNNTLLGQRAGNPPEGVGDSSIIASETICLGYASGQGNHSSNPASTITSGIMIGNRNGPTIAGTTLINTTILGHDTYTGLSNVCVVGSPTQNVLIGQSATDNGAKLQVQGNASIFGGVTYIGNSTSIGNSIGGTPGTLFVSHQSSNFGLVVQRAAGVNTSGANMVFRQTYGNDFANPAAVGVGAELGIIRWIGTPTNLLTGVGASLRAFTEVVGSNYISAGLDFRTTSNDGTQNDFTRMYLSASGDLQLFYSLGSSGNVIVGADNVGKLVKRTDIPSKSSGSGAPSSTPVAIGDFYIDTTGLKLYFATGTSSSADWIAAN